MKKIPDFLRLDQVFADGRSFCLAKSSPVTKNRESGSTFLWKRHSIDRFVEIGYNISGAKYSFSEIFAFERFVSEILFSGLYAYDWR
jgi:hypothetical protein